MNLLFFMLSFRVDVKSSLPLKKCVVSIKRYVSLIKLTIVFIITTLDFNKTHHPQGTPGGTVGFSKKTLEKSIKTINHGWLHRVSRYQIKTEENEKQQFTCATGSAGISILKKLMKNRKKGLMGNEK